MATLISSAVAGKAALPKAPVRRRPPPAALKRSETPAAQDPVTVSSEPLSSPRPPSPLLFTQEKAAEDDAEGTENERTKREPSPSEDDSGTSKHLPLQAFETLNVDDDVAGSAEGVPSSPASVAHTGVELMPEFIRRMQRNICAEPVKIRASRDLSVEPAIVEETALCVVSKVFARDFSRTWEFARFFNNAEDEDKLYTFFDAQPKVVETFLYWLINRSIPAQDDFDSEDLVSGVAYQMLLAKAYAFAEDKRIKEMMNDVMPVFMQTFADTKLEQPTLQAMLRFAARGSMLRMVVLEEALRLQTEDDDLMIKTLDKKWMAGIDGDIQQARRRFNNRGASIGLAPDYTVELDPIAPQPHRSNKRSRTPPSLDSDTPEPSLTPDRSETLSRASSPAHSEAISRASSPGRLETAEPDFDPTHPPHIRRTTPEDRIHPERTRYFSPDTFAKLPPKIKPARRPQPSQRLPHPPLRTRYFSPPPAPSPSEEKEEGYAGDYLTVRAPAQCECEWKGGYRKHYPKIEGEEVPRTCPKCGRYKRAVMGKKFAWRMSVRRWMWVPLEAAEGLGPADGDEGGGWV
ncbi:hypothetical protein B0A54_09199 [Friedmanniomyces endolithicus]|uniref:Uncharacterized protein n=1 Tax=Friedmanniomyces endolithicus TaxID=329885 RepID=A0A4V5N9K9_9PEZI|nr:hypothetical protein LTS09_001420 [Friedmanniomyces endolithicus]TKA38259.1 hypothetical protein B0A54_09199 [Friedmanniomyces endolithicus]